VCRLIFYGKLNATSSLKTILTVKKSSLTLNKESHSKVCSELPCLGQFNVAAVGIHNFSIPNSSVEFCALFCVACVNVEQHA
jgi:hypothetical protein